MRHELVSLRVAQNLFKRFQSGNFDIKDEPRSGRPVTDIVDTVLEEFLVTPVSRLTPFRDFLLPINLGLSRPPRWRNAGRALLITVANPSGDRVRYGDDLACFPKHESSERRPPAVEAVSLALCSFSTASVKYSRYSVEQHVAYTRIEKYRIRNYRGLGTEDVKRAQPRAGGGSNGTTPPPPPARCIDQLTSSFKDGHHHDEQNPPHITWFSEFNRGRSMFTDEFTEGRPESVVVPQNIDAGRKLIMQDHHVTYREIKASLWNKRTDGNEALSSGAGAASATRAGRASRAGRVKAF
ncbi:hypothetical protein EVAR_17271_1 [Eumeta japonica]|uniref:Uncharacterized protein n=1 Tax=Eumeta variegata TaxID=151549 RepID=A0A4C1TTK7_EUMVA|nr:hypothetical protein EVAR_17271_1 [Eumeta japonica]